MTCVVITAEMLGFVLVLYTSFKANNGRSIVKNADPFVSCAGDAGEHSYVFRLLHCTPQRECDIPLDT